MRAVCVFCVFYQHARDTVPIKPTKRNFPIMATTGTKLITPPGIMSFPALFAARAPAQGAEPRFSVTLIFDAEAQKSEEYKALKDAILEAAYDEFGKNVNMGSLRFPIRKSEEKSQFQGYVPGTVFASAWTKTKPGIVDAKLDEINDGNAIWAGQLARMSVTPFAYANSGNKGVSLGLRHVQILRMDMPRLDGRGSADSDFGKAPLPQGFQTSSSVAADDEVPF